MATVNNPSVVMNAPKVGGRAYARAAQRVEEKRVGMESPVHGLRKVSHDVRHVITLHCTFFIDFF